MKKRRTEHEFTDRQERILLRAAGAAVKMGLLTEENPGCPEPSTIRNLANRRIPLPQTGDFVDHVATCASCFQAYHRYRRRRQTAKVGVPILAVILCFAALMLVWPHHAAKVPSAKRDPATVPAMTPLKATVDFRNQSPTRSAGERSDASAPPRLPKEKLDLTILLPFGTEDGPYSVQLRSQTGEPVIETKGTATWTGNAEALTTSIDLRPLASGEYTFALRRSGASWRTYKLVLEEPR